MVERDETRGPQRRGVKLREVVKYEWEREKQSESMGERERGSGRKEGNGMGGRQRMSEWSKSPFSRCNE